MTRSRQQKRQQKYPHYTHKCVVVW